MNSDGRRINVSLGPEHARKLERLAARTHVNEGTLARSLLAQAIDETDIDAENIVALLDSIPGAFEQAAKAQADYEEGRTISLDEFRMR